MKNEIERKRLYREAFAIIEQANKLLADAKAKHEISVARSSNKAA